MTQTDESIVEPRLNWVNTRGKEARVSSLVFSGRESTHQACHLYPLSFLLTQVVSFPLLVTSKKCSLILFPARIRARMQSWHLKCPFRPFLKISAFGRIHMYKVTLVTLVSPLSSLWRSRYCFSCTSPCWMPLRNVNTKQYWRLPSRSKG